MTILCPLKTGFILLWLSEINYLFPPRPMAVSTLQSFHAKDMFNVIAIR